jgi:hypothetical protein
VRYNRPALPGEASTLGSNRYSPEQAELVEQRARAVSDTGERIVANRNREITLIVSQPIQAPAELAPIRSGLRV